MTRTIARSLLCLALVLIPIEAAAQEGAVQNPPELQVYNAVLALLNFPKQNPNVLISSVTLNTGCGEASGNPVLMNGCGIFAPPTSATDMETLLKQDMPALSDATWLSFVRQNARSETLADQFKTTWPHFVADIAKSNNGPMKSIDAAIFLSRVGLNADHTQAVVYVLFFSYLASVPTSGNFFLFQLDDKGAWQPNGRVTSMQTK